MREIVVALDVELRDGEQARMWSSGTRNVEAWECVRLAAPIITRSGVERALDLDPSCADAYSLMALYYMERKEFDQAIESAEKSIELAKRRMRAGPLYPARWLFVAHCSHWRRFLELALSDCIWSCWPCLSPVSGGVGR